MKAPKRILKLAVFVLGMLLFAGLLNSPVQAEPPFFKLYFMIPNSQPPRMVWGTLAAQQMTKLGIDVVSSYVPWSIITPRRNQGEGKTYTDGGWDAYLERYYYNTILPTPNNLFHSSQFPPNGTNYYYIDDPVIDKALEDYAGAIDQATRTDAIKRFQKRWYETEPMTILFYPEDVIAINPKLKGFDSTTFQPVFYPRPENWTIEGAGDDAQAAFASWPQPNSLVPMYSIAYFEANIYGPVYETLLEYDNWTSKKLVPALAEDYTVSEDGKHWVIKLRQGVTWHSGEEFTAEDVKFTWDVLMNKAYTSHYQALMEGIF